MKNLICVCVMWNGQSYANDNVSVSSIFKNGLFFPNYHFLCHKSFPHKRFKDSRRLQTPIWKYVTRHVTVVLFSILLHHCDNIFSFSSPNVCIKYYKIRFCIFFQFWRNVLKSSESDIPSMTSLGRPQDVSLIINKIGF